MGATRAFGVRADRADLGPKRGPTVLSEGFRSGGQLLGTLQWRLPPLGDPGLSVLVTPNYRGEKCGLESIGHLNKLTGLNLSGSKITDAGMRYLEALSELENLVLEHTAISDACLDSLSNLKRLSFIHLTDTKVTEAGEKQLRKKLPNLQLNLR